MLSRQIGENMKSGLLSAMTLAAVIFPTIICAAEPEKAQEEAGFKRLSLSLGSNYRSAIADDMALRRVDATIGVSGSPWPWLAAFVKLHLGRTYLSFSYDIAKDASMSGKAYAPTDVSLEVGVAAKVFTYKRLALHTYASYEAIPGNPSFKIDEVKMNSPFGLHDATDYCREHADFRYHLSKLDIGAGGSLKFGRFVPRLTIAYQRLSASFDPRLDRQAEDLISLFGYDAKKDTLILSSSKDVLAVIPGLTVKLPANLAIDMELATTPMPTSKFFTVGLYLSWSPL
jgi:hypothetical protein